ncbi:MAG: HigA family addiction module antitoxin [Thermodesulfobacteriota bacterium]
MKTKKLPPVSPGEVLRDLFMKPLGLTQHELAAALGVDVTRINRIIKGKTTITPDTALRLGRYFGTSAQLWLNMQTRYDLEIAEDKLWEEIRRTVKPRLQKDLSQVSAG